MPKFLLIDTSTNCCSVAISDSGHVLHQELKCEGYEHASLLPNFVNECLKNQDIALKNIDAIGISIGPGSYTGLRVGLSFAKALCYANQIPLITISTLEMMACGMKQITNGQEGFYLPMIDARRMEVYTAIFNNKSEWIQKPFPKIITDQFFLENKLSGKIFVAGSGAFKLKSFSYELDIKIIEDSVCEAKNLATQTNILFQQSAFADLAYCEPFYLKEFGEII